MSLSKKKSRPITVDGEVYRWAASQDSGFVTLVAQHEENNARRLEINISSPRPLTDEMFSVGFGGIYDTIVPPRVVARLIRQSIALGWNPHEKGPPVELSLDGDELTVRRGI